MFLFQRLLPAMVPLTMPVPAPEPRADRCSCKQMATTVLFSSAAEAWFWYLACHPARLDGARAVAGMAAVSRPCEPADIHRIVSRLYRTGNLRPQHLAVLVRYGRTMLSTDPDRPDESRDLLDRRAGLTCPDRALRARQIVA